jgi:hypothetical protein
VNKRINIGLSAVVVLLGVWLWVGPLGSSDGDPPQLGLTSPDVLGASAINEVSLFTTLEGMVAGSDLIVTGQIRSVGPGAEFGRPGIDRVYYAIAELEVTDVLGGKLPPGSDARVVNVNFFMGGQADVSALAEKMVGVAGIWFLTDNAAETRRAGGDESELERYAGLYRLVSSQGLVADFDGEAWNAFGERLEPIQELFLATDGKDFDTVVEMVRNVDVAPCLDPRDRSPAGLCE